MLIAAQIEVPTTVSNIDPISTPSNAGIDALMMFVPYNNRNLASALQKTLIVSDVALTFDVYAADDATIPTGADKAADSTELGKRVFFIAQTAITLVPNVLTALTLPLGGWIYLRVTGAPATPAHVKVGIL